MTNSTTSAIDSGDTAWSLSTTALILLQTIPGLALYYGGMVRVQHVLSTAMQSFSITCLITFVWLCFGYSLCFAPTDGGKGSAVIGGSSRFWLVGMDVDSIHILAPTIPESVFCVRQLTFAIITPSLISGSFANRMKYRSMLLFMLLWHIFVYCPIAHANWHPNGFLYRLGSLDFAGGNVVHITAGMGTLVASMVIGSRGFGTERFEPHNILLTVVGACFLWVGWYGFNAGSFHAANGRAGFAMLTTQIASSCSALTWMLTEWKIKEFPTVLGMLSGAIAGLIAITPSAGYVDVTGAFVIGFLTGPICYFGVHIKQSVGFEDALDAFGLHAIGGIFGGLMTGFFARASICGVNGVIYGNGPQLLYQIAGVSFSVGWSGIVTYILLITIDKLIGLRIVPEDEVNDIDGSYHGAGAAAISGGGSFHGPPASTLPSFTNHNTIPGSDNLGGSVHGGPKRTSRALDMR